MSTHKSWLYSSTNSCSTRSFGLLTYSYSTSRGRSCRWDVGGEENGAAAIDIFTQSPRLQVTHRLSVARWAFVCFRSKTEDEDASSHLRISLFDRCDNVTGFYLLYLLVLVHSYCKKVTVPGIFYDFDTRFGSEDTNHTSRLPGGSCSLSAVLVRHKALKNR